ncbi:hypothetical protein GCM10009579_72820 [Streptomyces javensis]|uniref:Uncharacterized protein n=1 Tax=Streptomyces javensis TaxID=114698 RepID=A0ABP4I3A0_9ACTN
MHQVGEFVSAGFRVVASNRRGTSRPPRAEAVDRVDDAADLNHLLDHLGVNTASPGRRGRWRPDRVGVRPPHPERVTSLALSGPSELSAGYRTLTPKESGAGRRLGPPRTKSGTPPHSIS